MQNIDELDNCSFQDQKTGNFLRFMFEGEQHLAIDLCSQRLIGPDNANELLWSVVVNIKTGEV